jgi:5-hydroxyisourate hydrolase
LEKVAAVPSLSTHILDASAGGPRAGVPVDLFDDTGTRLASATTDRAGRINDLAFDLKPGCYQLMWQIGDGFLAAVRATVNLTEERHYHVPLLASDASVVVYLGV